MLIFLRFSFVCTCKQFNHFPLIQQSSKSDISHGNKKKCINPQLSNVNNINLYYNYGWLKLSMQIKHLIAWFKKDTNIIIRHYLCAILQVHTSNNIILVFEHWYIILSFKTALYLPYTWVPKVWLCIENIICYSNSNEKIQRRQTNLLLILSLSLRCII